MRVSLRPRILKFLHVAQNIPPQLCTNDNACILIQKPNVYARGLNSECIQACSRWNYLVISGYSAANLSQLTVISKII